MIKSLLKKIFTSSTLEIEITLPEQKGLLEQRIKQRQEQLNALKAKNEKLELSIERYKKTGKIDERLKEALSDSGISLE